MIWRPSSSLAIEGTSDVDAGTEERSRLRVLEEEGDLVPGAGNASMECDNRVSEAGTSCMVSVKGLDIETLLLGKLPELETPG